jgi:hypothetical protein
MWSLYLLFIITCCCCRHSYQTGLIPPYLCACAKTVPGFLTSYVVGFFLFSEFMVGVFNATSNNISVLSWRSVLLVEETELPGENHPPAANHWQIYHIIFYRVDLACMGLELTTLVVIGTDCTGSCKSNYHTITTMMVPHIWADKQFIYCLTNLRNILILFLTVKEWHQKNGLYVYQEPTYLMYMKR